MNKKIRLNLDDLVVESFDTTPAASPADRGTVRGLQSETCAGQLTCDFTCLTDVTCNPQACQTDLNCGESQYQLCVSAGCGTQVNCTASDLSPCESVIGCPTQGQAGCPTSAYTCAATCGASCDGCSVGVTCNCL